jgi:PmbA protein
VKPFRLPAVIQATNLVLLPGRQSKDELLRLARIEVTDVMGFAFDPRTGAFSRSARGFVLSRGRRAAPLPGLVISGNLRNVIETIVIADDATRTANGTFPSVLVHVDVDR